MNARIRPLTLMVAGLVSIGLLGCDARTESTESATKQANTQSKSTLPDGLFVDTELPDPRGVGELKADTDATGDVVVHGRIGGRVEPFVPGVAMFLLADAEMKTCDELHEDKCPTPWDYCCEPRDSLKAKIATVQIIGDDGKPLRIELAGEHGLEPSAHVTIAGEVAQRDGGSLVINARKIHVHDKKG